MTPAAARVGDPIAHNIFAPALKRAGFEAGVVVEILLIVGTGGTKKGLQIAAKVGGRKGARWLARKLVVENVEEAVEEAAKKSWLYLAADFIGDVADVLDGAVIGHWIGGGVGYCMDSVWNALAGLFGSTGGMTTGAIASGASRTFVEGKAAARMYDPVTCEGSTTMLEKAIAETIGTMTGLGGISSLLNEMYNAAKGQPGAGTAHIGMDIAQGSISVYIEQQPAARVGDATKCDALVSKGAGSVGFGGIPITAPESIQRYEEGDGVGFGLWLASFAWALSLLSSFGKSIEVLYQNKDPSFTIWQVWQGTPDGRSFWLKMLGLNPATRDAASVADRYQKINAALKEGKSMAEALKGLELTGGKVVKSIATGGGNYEFQDAGGKPLYQIRSNGEVVVYQSDKVTPADVEASKAWIAGARERRLEQIREQQKKLPPPPPNPTTPRRHPGMGGR